MDEILVSTAFVPNSSLHVATLSRQTLLDSGAEHLGLEGYFLFEVNDSLGAQEINVLGKAVSLEAALRLADLLSRGIEKFQVSAPDLL